MADKTETAAKPGRAEAKPRKREVTDSAAEREAALVMAATRFKALGDPTRLRIIKFLSSVDLLASNGVESDADADSGRTVGDVSNGVFGKSKVSSTLSHHLKELRNAGLITMKRRGKNLICRIQPDSVEALRCYLPDFVLVPVAVKAQLTAPTATVETAQIEANAPAAADTGIPASGRTPARKSAVRKKKTIEGASHLESGITTDDQTPI